MGTGKLTRRPWTHTWTPSRADRQLAPESRSLIRCSDAVTAFFKGFVRGREVQVGADEVVDLGEGSRSAGSRLVARGTAIPVDSL